MSACPFHHPVRKDLPELPPRIAALPVDERGYPVPFFVAWIEGKPEFRIADSAKLVRCVMEKLCWVCGQKLGRHMAFVIGPMCSVNRITAEPPSHLDCAEWSVKGCPFLSKPQMVRREDELTEANKENVAGEMITRNPGVILIWVTRSYRILKDPSGKPLFEIGEPEETSWWRLGRTATRSEVLESIESGILLLEAKCDGDDDLAALNMARTKAEQLLPTT